MANRKQRRAGAAKARKEMPQSKEQTQDKPQIEYSGVSAYILTAREIPDSLLQAIGHNLNSAAAVYIYCRADTYSVSMRPLEFGAALALLPMRHTGQLQLVRLYNEDETVPVETESLGVITSFEELKEAWRNTIDMVWEVEPEPLVPLEQGEYVEGSDLDTPPVTDVNT